MRKWAAMIRIFAIWALLIIALCSIAIAQNEADCPPPTSVVHNGVCVDKKGKDCSAAESRTVPLVCFSPDAPYTEEARAAHIKGTVRLSATVDTNGCAKDIKLVTPLGYGLDQSAVSALRVWRFRKPKKATRIYIEVNFDPQFSANVPFVYRSCEDEAARAHAAK